MNVALKRNLAIASTLVISALSFAGSASATSLPFPRSIKCTCMGRYVPPKLCPMIHCPEASTKTTITGEQPTTERYWPDALLDRNDATVIGEQPTQDLIAGRYRTRGPGGGIGRTTDEAAKLFAKRMRQGDLT